MGGPRETEEPDRLMEVKPSTGETSFSANARRGAEREDSLIRPLEKFSSCAPVLTVRAAPPCSAAISTLFSPHQRSSGKWRSAEDCSAAT